MEVKTRAEADTAVCATKETEPPAGVMSVWAPKFFYLVESDPGVSLLLADPKVATDCSPKEIAAILRALAAEAWILPGTVKLFGFVTAAGLARYVPAFAGQQRGHKYEEALKTPEKTTELVRTILQPMKGKEVRFVVANEARVSVHRRVLPDHIVYWLAA